LVLGTLIERNFLISYELHGLGLFLKPIVVGTFILGFGSLMLTSYRSRTAKSEGGRVSQSP
jgi:hypothetical protein